MTKPAAIKPVGQFDIYQRVMIVADSGFGKTVFGGTARKGLFLTTDPEGTVSAKARGSSCEEWKIPDWDELNKAYRYLRDGGIKELGIDWLIIDNASETQNIGMVETMRLARDRNKSLDEFVPTQQDYQRSQNMMRQMVKKYNDLPVNILWTSWQAKEEDDEGELFYSPGIHGQKGMLAQTIAGYMNIVGYGEVIEKAGKEVRRIHFSHHGPFRGKDRFDVLGKYRDELTIPKLEAIIKTASVQKAAAPKAATGIAKKPVAARRTATPRKKA